MNYFADRCYPWQRQMIAGPSPFLDLAEPTIMRARDGTIIEVSEWKSHEAIDAAHKNPNVLAMWDKFFALCDCIPLSGLAEANEMFAGFEPIAD